jgi:hypothetical protein
MYSNYRYLVFAYDCYYPNGGFEDFEFAFNTLPEYEERISEYTRFNEYWYILDLTNLNNIEIGNFDYLERYDISIKNKLIENVSNFFNGYDNY